MESLVTIAITGTECITNRQTDRQTFFFIYIDDERNFHCWAYRYYLLEHLWPSSSSSSDLESFYENELTFLRSTIDVNLSNYSAWHYRSKYLEKLFDLNPSRRSAHFY